MGVGESGCGPGGQEGACCQSLVEVGVQKVKLKDEVWVGATESLDGGRQDQFLAQGHPGVSVLREGCG